MLKKLFIVLAICICASSSIYAQKRLIYEGDAYYESFFYAEAIKKYEEALAKIDPLNEPYVTLQLARCHQFLFQYPKSEEYYGKTIAITPPPVDPQIYLDYAVMLKLNGRYEDAKEELTTFQTLTGEHDPRGNAEMQSLNWAMENTNVSKPVTITETDMNVSGQSMGYCFFDGGMIYAHGRNKKPNAVQQPLFDLDYLEIEDSVHFLRTDNLLDHINFSGNETSPSISPNGVLLYFSANAAKVKNGEAKKVEGMSDGISNFKIYVSSFANGKFENIQELPFNNINYNCVHPCVNEDENTLYFASDMPGGYGGFDLYMVKRDIDGRWGTPVNLGNGINTVSNELFPSIHRGRIYFSSKGLRGYGGYDIYTAQISNISGIPSFVQNLGKPVNSFKDDIAFIAYDGGRFGYFSSNRNNDDGTDKVYFFHDHTLDIGPVTPIVKKDSVIASSKPVGKPVLPVIAKQDTVKPTAQGLIAMENETDDDLVKRVFRNVQFRLNDFRFGKDYGITLDSVVTLLKKRPNIKVVVSAYTDSRGSSKYNQLLSERRANAVRIYLVNKRIPSSRIITKGYGETVLLNKCADGVPCSEAEHSVNRRVELKLEK